METPNQDDVILQILASGDENDDLLHSSLLETVRRMGQGVPVSASLRDRVLNEIVALWQKMPFWKLYPALQEIFREVASPVVADALSVRLLAEVTDRNTEDIALARIAGLLGKREEAMAVLLEFAQQEIQYPGDEDDVIEALRSLIAIGKADKAIPLLLEIARDPLNEDAMRREAIRSLVTCEDTDSKVDESLCEFAHDEQMNDFVRVEAIVALKHRNRLGLVLPILPAIVLNRENNGDERRRVARILGDLGEKEFAVAHLRNILHDTEIHPFTQYDAAKDLVELGFREEGLQVLMHAASGNAACGNCGGASCGLGRGYVVGLLNKLEEHENASSSLIQAIEAQTVANYGKAVDAAQLAKIGETEIATRYLLDIIQSVEPKDYAYGEAIEALGKWGARTAEVFNVLFAIARETALGSSLSWRALEALGNFGNNSPEVREFLVQIAREYPGTPQARSASDALWDLTHM